MGLSCCKKPSPIVITNIQTTNNNNTNIDETTEIKNRIKLEHMLYSEFKIVNMKNKINDIITELNIKDDKYWLYWNNEDKIEELLINYLQLYNNQ